MIKVDLIWILVLIFYVVSFLGLILVSYFTKDKQTKFSFLNCFPFELINGSGAKVFLYMFVILSFLPLLVIIPRFGEFGDFAIYNLILTCLFGLLALANAAMIVISTKYITPHIKLATGVMAGSFLMAALTALHFFLDYSVQKKFSNAYIYLIFGILSALLAILMLLIMFNPKLKNWAQLEEHIDGENKIYDRPKKFPLAYSEWIALGVSVISFILFMVSMINF